MRHPTTDHRAPARWLKILALAACLSLVSLNLTTSTANAATTCDPADDTCVVVPDTAQTPLGLVTVTVSASHVVTVHLDPVKTNIIVFGVPFGYPAAPSAIPGYARTSIPTSGGLINIDTIAVPPGPVARFSFPSVAVISIIPPGPPCRATQTGTTVVFTPITQPGPLN
jgi:hypothetical protein